MRAIERGDQGLHDAHRAVECAHISPGFQVMRFGDVPVAILRGFVKMRATVNERFDLFPVVSFVKDLLGSIIDAVLSGIDWLDAENEPSRHLALAEIRA